MTDYRSGDTPIPIGAVVQYHGSLSHGLYTVTARLKPLSCGQEMAQHYPDGVAYEIWPVGVEKKFGNRYLAVYNVRRTSFTVVPPDAA